MGEFALQELAVHCVDISARIIRWPHLCACCCKSPDTSVAISNTRETGKKVVREQTKSWEIPYCRRCLSHIDAARELQKFSTFVRHRSLVIGLVGVGIAVTLGGMLHKELPRTAVAVLVLALAATAAVVVATYEHCRRLYLLELQAKHEEQHRLKTRLKSLLSDGCAMDEQLAATYGGWYGSVHTFYFASSEFAASVEAANPGKCLTRGQRHHGGHEN